MLKVTPDPGVIEVNVQPAANWEELDDITTGVYEDAQLARLGTENSSSTAGTPAPAAAITSCWAGRRRPTARSCAGPICCGAWCATGTTIRRCRTLFCGLFIGPTSQAPRVDEGRRDAIYELEIAFEQVPDDADTCRRGSSTASFAICWST